jgi:hypothetical protein
MNISVGTNLTAVLSEPLNELTVNSSTFQLRDGFGVLIPSSVSYTAGSNNVTLTPATSLKNATVYYATLKGGSAGIKDTAGNALVTDYTWSFTTLPLTPAEGQGGPILVITTSLNPFSSYITEILRAEGLNEFAAADIATVTPGQLNNYNVVVLGEMELLASDVTMLTDWVNAGGLLIAFKPSSLLLPLMGLSNATGTLSDKFLLVNTLSGRNPGVGIVNQTIQFHGTANLHTITGGSGAVELARLYSAAATSTTNPAVTLRKVGSLEGKGCGI